MSNYTRAHELNKIGDHERALPFAERAVREDPSDANNWCNLSWAFNGLGRRAEALDAADEALGLNPESEWGYRARAEALRHLGRRSEALASARKAVSLAPDKHLPWQQLAAMAKVLGYPDEARRAAKRAVQLGPNVATAWIGLSFVCLDSDWEEGANAAQRALELEPENHIALNNLGWARFKQGRFAEAREFLDRGIAIAPRDWRLPINRALVTSYIDGPEAGKAEYVRAQTFRRTLYEQRLAENPDDYEAFDALAFFRRALDSDFQGAVESARHAVSLNGRAAEAWSELREAAGAAERWGLARYAARQAVHADESAPDRWLAAAVVAEHASHLDEARYWARRVVDEAPESSSVLGAQALLAYLEGDFEGALRIVEADLARSGEQCCDRVLMARCHFELGDKAAALGELDRARVRVPVCNCYRRQHVEQLLES